MFLLISLRFQSPQFLVYLQRHEGHVRKRSLLRTLDIEQFETVADQDFQGPVLVHPGQILALLNLILSQRVLGRRCSVLEDTGRVGTDLVPQEERTVLGGAVVGFQQRVFELVLLQGQDSKRSFHIRRVGDVGRILGFSLHSEHMVVDDHFIDLAVLAHKRFLA